MLIYGDVKTHHQVTALSVRSGWTVICSWTALTKSKRLRPAQLGSLLFDTPQSTLASVGVLFGTHLNIALRKATHPVVHEEGTVASVEYIHFRVRQFRILMSIQCAIPMSNELRPGSVC